MKATNKLGCAALILALFIICGCATTSDRENTLAAAGFHTVIATTSAQKQQLQTLQPDRITPVVHGKETVFVYPDRDRNLLYVGREADYQQYRKLRLEKQIADEKLEAAQMWSEPSWSMWAPWGGWVY